MSYESVTFINDKIMLSTKMERPLEWIVFPYFGGTYPAPHRMEFDIKFEYDKVGINKVL